jgi:phosphatidylinositol-3-phosphatase
MSTSDPTATEPRSTLRCAGCDSPLAHDQRYCVECGARRGPLPLEIAALIGAIHEQGPAPDLPPGTPLADSFADGDRSAPAFGFAMPGPRAAAAAVMCMLGFGVIVGSLVGGTSVATLASAPLIVVGMNHPAAAPVTQTVAAAQAPSGGGGAAAAAGGSGAAAVQSNAQASATPTTSPSSTADTGTTSAGLNGLPPIKHVFMIVLSDRGYTQSFGASNGYLSGALRHQGELVLNYYAVAASPLANEIALISGQGPTVETATDCPTFTRISHAGKGATGQVIGVGCAYPDSTKTLAGELTAAGDTWKAYVQGVPSSAKSACRVPKPGSKVPQTAGSKNAYLAWRNPFLYFRSLTGGSACHDDEVGLGQLKADLKSASKTPSLAYIIPAPCSDGSEAPCKHDATPSLAGANQFLKTVVPEIKKSPAYKDGGMIAITFDEAPQTGQYADPSACCASPASYPNLRGLPPGTPVPPAAATGPATPGTTSTGAAAADTTTTDTTTTTTDTTTTDTTPSDTTTTDTTTPPTTAAGTTTTDTTTTATTTTPTTTTETTVTGTTTTGTTTTAPTTTAPVSLGNGETTPTGGGGQVGLLLISPYVKKNSFDVVDYFNHFSLLATIENLFGLHRLGYSDAPGLPLFSTGVFNNYAG